MLAVLDLAQSGRAHHRGHLHRASRSRCRSAGSTAVRCSRSRSSPRSGRSSRAAQRPLDARLLPPPRRSDQGDHLLGRPHPRRAVVLHAAHAGVPGGRADLLDDRLVPGRGPGHRASDADADRRARPGAICPTSRIAARRPASDVEAALHRSPGGSAPHPLADLPGRRGRARAAPGGVDAGATRRSPTTRASTAPRSPTSAT